MKKLLLLSAFLFIGTLAFSQDKYISPGASYSNHTYSEGLEVGYFNSHTWLGALVSTSKDAGSSHYSTFAGVKAYEKIFSVGIVDFYGYGGVYYGFDAGHPIEFEPGVSPVINLSKYWALQVSGSVPIYTKTPTPSYPSVGLSVNYYF